jgi:hypothetical protein
LYYEKSETTKVVFWTLFAMDPNGSDRYGIFVVVF